MKPHFEEQCIHYNSAACMGDFLGLEVVNDTCGKTSHVGTLDRGFAVQQNTHITQFSLYHVHSTTNLKPFVD